MEEESDDARVVSGRPGRLILVGDVESLGEGTGGRARERTDLPDTLDIESMGLVVDYVREWER